MRLQDYLRKLFGGARPRGEGKSQRDVDYEDCLKALFTLEQEGGGATLDRLGERTTLEGDRLATAVGTLVLKGYISTPPLSLTEEGRRSALALVRAHRIYEMYLAEHTGYKADEWHDMADRMEHTISSEEQERITSLLRNPLYDPHGDPIPTASFDLPAVPSTDVVEHLKAGAWLKVAHVEDDDVDLFRQIHETGLSHGSLIRVLELEAERFAFAYEGERFALPREALRALTLCPASPDEVAETEVQDVRRLSTLKEGQEARIVGLSPSCRGAMRRRLLDLGFVKGSVVSIDMKSPLGNPIAYVVRGSAIALREDQAKYILVARA